ADPARAAPELPWSWPAQVLAGLLSLRVVRAVEFEPPDDPSLDVEIVDLVVRHPALPCGWAHRAIKTGSESFALGRNCNFYASAHAAGAPETRSRRAAGGPIFRQSGGLDEL